MGLQDIFWVSGDDETADQAEVHTQPTKIRAEPNTSAVSLTDEFSNNLPPEIVYFEEQWDLFAAAIKDDRQLMAIVLINTKQKYPDVDATVLLGLYNDCKQSLAESEQKRVHAAAQEMQTDAASCVSELEEIENEIGLKRVEVDKLLHIRDNLSEALDRFEDTNIKFNSDIEDEYDGILAQINNQTKLLINNSEKK